MDDELLEDLYYYMLLGRYFEYGAKENYLQGNISGFLHLDIGQEALSVGAMKAFEGDVFTTYREHVMAIARGISIKSVMAELFGKIDGVSKGRGGSMHMFSPELNFYGGDAIVGGHIPNAVGCAYARKYQGIDTGTLVVFGDGATNCGAFFESINIASVNKLPILFLCENNKYAIGTHISKVSSFEKQAQKAKIYMPTMEVDGMDVVAVYETVTQAQGYIKEGNGPIFVEAMTCRFEGHSISDSNQYRSSQEMELCKAQDPIEKLKAHINKDVAKSLEQKVINEIEMAVKFAKESEEPDIKDLKKYMYTQEGLKHVI
ncbi:MAG: pyruvate dehydrogenase [Sulfurimonas sp.]|nr:MAG: pyruvate dehydrogenase [Sulfurimonas sp.]